MPKVTIRMQLRLRDTKTVFKPGWGEGVLVMQDVTFKFPDNYTDDWMAVAAVSEAVSEASDKFMNESVEVLLEEIPNDQVNKYPGESQNESL